MFHERFFDDFLRHDVPYTRNTKVSVLELYLTNMRLFLWDIGEKGKNLKAQTLVLPEA